MLRLVGAERRGGRTGRREFLSLGTCLLGGVALGDLARLRAAAEGTGGAAPRTDRAIIVLWCHGGISQLETYDVKTTGTSLFPPIGTAAPEIRLSSLLPRHARIADKLTILRSLSHDQADHGWGTRRFVTGYGKELRSGQNSDAYHPAVECGVNRALGELRNGLPVSVNLGQFHGTPWRGPGIWGSRYGVPQVEARRGGPAQGMQDVALRLPVERVGRRRELLTGLDRLRRKVDGTGTLDAMDAFDRQAWEVLLGGNVAQAFDLSREPEAELRRYGEGNENVLLARRLVEQGVNFVNVYVSGRPPGSTFAGYNWDDHAVNWDIKEAMELRLPWFDHVVSTLVEDVHARGLAEKVLIVVASEFGRTPRLDTNKPGVLGRDHYPRAMSVLVAGGGRERGNVIGATDAQAAAPTVGHCDPHDFLATLYAYLGIDHRRTYVGNDNRPVPLTYGEPIPGLA